ncbi:APC family permease [Rhodococcus erythropolis]|uniref:APC family permease n=1 Tax=Rhodococcus erythropolis TaxID=1833 RepID=UPI0008BC31A0|nr:APC family permease [Rhodococcus erythropolis]OFV79055.1 putative amino acid permease YhdG [Rhodococcus erythropolis]
MTEGPMASTGHDEPRAAAGKLAGGKLGTAQIFFFVVAAASPLSVVLSSAPFSLRLGGIGAPGVILATGVVLMLFACGFTAMSHHIRNAGAFYAYIGQGLGGAAGGGTAMMTLTAYVLCVIGFVGNIGVFAQASAANVLHVDVPWQVWSLVCVAIVGAVGYGQIDVGAKVLAVLLTLEIGVLVVLLGAILVQGGPEGPSAAPFSVDNVFFADGSGTLFLLAFGAYIGFESTAIYGEEAKSPKRTIPRATYFAVGFLALFYAFSFWVVVYGYGIDGALVASQSNDYLGMVFVEADTYVGGALVAALHLLIVTSFLMTIIAFHNASTRYMFSLSRDGMLPRALARTHSRMSSPHVASVVLSVITFVAVVLAIIAGLDPYLELGTWPYASGVIGIVAAQAICALAVIAYFRRDRRGFSALRVIGAPILGFLGLAAGLYLMISNFTVLSGYSGTLPNAIMIGVMPAAFVVGAVVQSRRGTGLRLRVVGDVNIADMP